MDDTCEVDEDRLEIMAMERAWTVSTRYEARGQSWACWIIVGGHPLGWCLHGKSRQNAFDQAMADLLAEVGRRGANSAEYPQQS